jgi:GAF domain-containing protein
LQDNDLSAHPAASFAEISRQLLQAPTLDDTLQRIVDLSVSSVSSCDAAAISFIQGDEVVTPAWTEPAVLKIDKLQYQTGEGPCLDAIARETVVYTENLPADPRWPKLGPLAAEAGIHSVLSLKLGTDDPLGSLNLYAKNVGAYGETELSDGNIFAVHAALALEAKTTLDRTARALEHEQTKLQKLQRALISRDIIGQAKGVLMYRDRITADHAFHELRMASQRLNIKLKDIAQQVVDTGEIPQSAF